MSPRASTIPVQVEPVADAAVQFGGTTLVAFTKNAMWAINDENYTQRPKAPSAQLDQDDEFTDEIRSHGGAFWRGTRTGSFSINLSPAQTAGGTLQIVQADAAGNASQATALPLTDI